MNNSTNRLSQIAIRTEGGQLHYDMTEANNPCFGCGVCCRHFRVSFYHGELDSQPGGYVPTNLTTQITPFRACMKGTEVGRGPCVAQHADGRCGIYALRPSVCREFPVFMPDGSMNPECLRLRAMYGIGTAS
ncbi:MAG: YkgJ family cysteine cluster protein [Pseudomonadota bacterium]